MALVMTTVNGEDFAVMAECERRAEYEWAVMVVPAGLVQMVLVAMMVEEMVASGGSGGGVGKPMLMATMVSVSSDQH